MYGEYNTKHKPELMDFTSSEKHKTMNTFLWPCGHFTTINVHICAHTHTHIHL